MSKRQNIDATLDGLGTLAFVGFMSSLILTLFMGFPLVESFILVFSIVCVISLFMLGGGARGGK